MGFIEITDSTTIPTTVLNRFIESHQVIPIKFTGRLHESRTPKVKPKKYILDHIFCQALCNMFVVKHNNVSKTIHNLPRYVQHQGSSIYYSVLENEFLSDILPDSVIYKEFDKDLYASARKRTTTKDSEKLLFHALGLSFVELQLMVDTTDILGIILQNYLFTNIFHPSTPASIIFKTIFQEHQGNGYEIILDWPS
jgi:hypothetical protein